MFAFVVELIVTWPALVVDRIETVVEFGVSFEATVLEFPVTILRCLSLPLPFFDLVGDFSLMVALFAFDVPSFSWLLFSSASLLVSTLMLNCCHAAEHSPVH